VNPYLDDGDVRLYQGDVREVLAQMPDACVDCIVTSPPYWQLRDYAGMATWEGGDSECDHLRPPGGGTGASTLGTYDNGLTPEKIAERVTVGQRQGYRDTCGKCGAVRHDFQIGLEPTIGEYVAAIVGVFRELRRVLAPHGTCWLNIGDSFAGSGAVDRRGDNSTGNGGPIPRAEKRTASTPSGLKHKDLCMVPARVALALQADGWWIRQRNVWAKPNPMPESVTDRTTSAAEEVFHLTKVGTGYYYDAEAVREPALQPVGDPDTATGRGSQHKFTSHSQLGATSSLGANHGHAGRNLRNVWSIATEPTPEAHFATFPLELVRRCLAAGCPERVCRECGRPSVRLVERTANGDGHVCPKDAATEAARGRRNEKLHTQYYDVTYRTAGWTDCGHDAYRPGIVLDPFIGSGKTAQQARRMGLHAIGIDGSAEYLAIAARRLSQLSLLSEAGP